MHKPGQNGIDFVAALAGAMWRWMPQTGFRRELRVLARPPCRPRCGAIEVPGQPRGRRCGGLTAPGVCGKGRLRWLLRRAGGDVDLSAAPSPRARPHVSTPQLGPVTTQQLAGDV